MDKYCDDILLHTIYSSAHEESLAELGLSPDQVKVERRVESAGSAHPPARETNLKEKTAVKQKMRATQRKYLSAAHDQIWGMLDTFKQKGEVYIH